MANLSSSHLSLSLSLSIFSQNKQGDFYRAAAVEIAPTELSLLIYDIRSVIYWLIMVGC